MSDFLTEEGRALLASFHANAGNEQVERTNDLPRDPAFGPKRGLRLDIGPMLRDARQAAGMTQAMVAASTGFEQSTVSRLEQLGCNPTIDTVLAYLRAVDAEIALTIIVGGEELCATETAHRMVVIPESARDHARRRGMSVRDHVLDCLYSQWTMREIRLLIHSETNRVREAIASLQSQVPGLQALPQESARDRERSGSRPCE